MADDDGPLFVKNGAPVKFCFHRSVRQGRGQITRDVERHGGQIVADERTANVLLVDEQEDIALLRVRYYSSTERYRLSIYVEPRGFVQTCIRSGSYQHVGPVKQGMPGRAPGRGARPRVPYTQEDRERLAYYIATRCPTRDGRMGNSIYKDLEQLGQTDDDGCWKWARRHTWHSWREHYKTRPQIMDPLIESYVRQLKNEGHHFGQDPRSHDYRSLRRELAEEEEEEEEDVMQREGIERQGVRGRQAPAPRRRDQAGRDYLARHEGELLAMEDNEEDVVIAEEPQRVERQTSNREATREIIPEEDPETQESEEIEGSDLFGDREYDNYDNQGPGPEDGPPPSTQATLVASPRFAEKEPTSTSITRPTAMIGERVQMPPPPSPLTIPPSSQLTLVMDEEHAVGIPISIRGASTEPGPSAPREKRARSAAAVNAHFRNTRARSRSVESQFQPRREDEGDNGKQEVKEEALMEEDLRIEEGRGAGRVSVNGAISAMEDERAVEGLLQASAENDEDTDEASDGDLAGLPRYEDIEIGDSEPSDSDDKETHGSLVRGVQDDEPRSEEEQSDEEDDHDEDDAERIERMANGKLVAAPLPTPPEPRVTRSKTASQISPRRTRSATQRALPSEYAPPQGTRAARVVRGRSRRG